LQKRLHY